MTKRETSGQKGVAAMACGKDPNKQMENAEEGRGGGREQSAGRWRRKKTQGEGLDG